MNSPKHFKRYLHFKFLLFRIFIVAAIVLVGISSAYFVQKITDEYSVIMEQRVAHMQTVQEARADTLTLGFHATRLLQRQEAHSSLADDDEDSLRELQRLLGEMRTFLASAQNHPEDMPHAQQVESLLQSLETDFRTAYTLHEQYEMLEKEGGEELERVHEEALASQDKALAHFEPLSQAFAQWDEALLRQIMEETAEIKEKSSTNLLLVVLLSLLAVFVTLLVGLIFSSRVIVRPLEELTKTAEEMADGKLSKRVEIHSRDEIGKLAYTFNKMAARLETSYDDLEKIVSEKTQALEGVLNQFESKNEDLEKSQMATINLLEDLENEKRAVEERVKLRTQELEREKNKLLQVTSNMRGGGILLDDKHEVIFVNEAACEMLGVQSGNVKTILASFLAHFQGDEIRAHFKRCIDGETFHVPEIDGNGRVYEIFFHHLKNNNETAGYFILFFDITDAKLLERSKSELVAVASHQLRTPLTAMRGNVEMLIDESFGSLNKEQHELLDDIDVSTIRLITMVNEMLDITKIERGNLELSMEKMNINEVITSVVADLQAYAQRHEFTIETAVAPDIVVDADKVRLRQIFQNLIDNAIKYSNHPGHLSISSEVKDGMAQIAFKDNGIGVPKNEQPKLFERFYRASNTAKSASSGSGLGLYIVKAIAQQFGGDIRFISEEGKGTTFFVTLPLSSNNNQ